MKKFLTCILVAMLAMPMLAKGPILSESFSYTAGAGLYGNGGWLRYSTNANEPIQVDNNSLTYTDYQDQAVGYAVRVAGGQDSGQDLWKRMNSSKDPIKSGNVYASFLMKMESAGSSKDGVFFFHMMSTSTSAGDPLDGEAAPTGTGTNARIFAAPSNNEGKFILAVARASASISAATPTIELNLNETYLIVLKYTWPASGNKGTVELFVNPQKSSEPTATLTNTDTGAGFTNGIIGVQLRQAGTNEKHAPNVIIDEIRMATNWADLFVQATGGDTPSTDPVITSSPSSLTFEDFKVGETNKKTISVTAANLTEDITITKTTDAISLSKTSITLDELAAGSVSIDVTINASQETDFTDVITFTSGATTEELNVTATVWEPIKEDVISFEALLNKTSTTDIIFTYKGTSARIFSVTKDNNQIVLIDNSGKMATVLLTDALWEDIQPCIGMKVKKFVFTAEFTGIPTKAICTPTTLEFKDADYTREVTNLNIGTICFKGIVNPGVLDNIDATFYKILYKQEYEGEVYNIVLEEVTELEENTPYIFQPNSVGTMKFYTTMGSEENAKSANGLIGTFSNINVEEGMYILYDNKIRQAGEGCTLAANRAYINMSQVPTESQAESQNVAMRHLTLQNMNAKTPTNLHHTQSLKTPKKYIVKGRLILENNGAKINVLGQSLK